MITVEVTIKAPIEKVWDFWITPKHIQNWNMAFDNWHTPYAENDLKENGKFKYVMTSKDKTESFDFEGIYTNLKDFSLIEYQLFDNRKGSIHFEENNGIVTISEIFEPNIHDPENMQIEWCQAVIDNFKKYAELH